MPRTCVGVLLLFVSLVPLPLGGGEKLAGLTPMLTPMQADMVNHLESIRPELVLRHASVDG